MREPAGWFNGGQDGKLGTKLVNVLQGDKTISFSLIFSSGQNDLQLCIFYKLKYNFTE